MKKRIGVRQAAILKVLSEHGAPMLGADLVIAAWESLKEPGACPFYFSESTRHAAAGLAKRGIILSGRPILDRNHKARVVFWLSGQTPPELDTSHVGLDEIERLIRARVDVSDQAKSNN